MSYILPGKLNVRVSIKKEIKTRSSTGEPLTDTVTITKCWAKRKDMSGDESIDGKIIEMNVRTYVVRYLKDFITNGTLYYVVDEDGEYNITQVNHVAHKKYLELKCFKRE